MDQKMPWSKFNLNKKEAVVVDYKPRAFELNNETSIQAYSDGKKKQSSFVMNDVVKKISGIEDIEKQAEEERVEQQILDRMVSVQEDAYKQAYELGREEGFRAAVEERRLEIEQSILKFREITESLEAAKDLIFKQNEAFFIKLVYSIGSKIALKELNEDTYSVLPVLKKIVESSYKEDKLEVFLSPSNFEVISKIEALKSQEFDFLKNITFFSSEDVRSGGCLIETNYGTIDAQVEVRVQQLEDELFSSVPKIKPVAV